MRSETKQIFISAKEKANQNTRMQQYYKYYNTVWKREATHSSMLCKTNGLKSMGAVLWVPPCSLRDRINLLARRETKTNLPLITLFFIT
jgi:hypothetical protein